MGTIKWAVAAFFGRPPPNLYALKVLISLREGVEMRGVRRT